LVMTGEFESVKARAAADERGYGLTVAYGGGSCLSGAASSRLALETRALASVGERVPGAGNGFTLTSHDFQAPSPAHTGVPTVQFWTALFQGLSVADTMIARAAEAFRPVEQP